MRTPVFAVIEIGGDPMLLLVAGVFIVTFLLVCALAYAFLARGRRDGEKTTFTLQFGTELPVSKGTFDRLASLTDTAFKPPEVSPETRATLETLDSARQVFARVYRILMIAIGLAGVVAGVLLMRSHTPANMQGLPGAIILLFALGALLKGLVPGPSIQPVEPLSPDLRRQMREKIRMEVVSNEIEVPLDERASRRLTEMLAQGASISEAARTVFPAYDKLSEAEKRMIETVLAKYNARDGSR